MRKAPIIIIVLLMTVFPVLAQGSKVDSLLRQLSRTEADTAKVWLLCAIAETYESNAPETAKYYLRQAGALSRQLKFKTGEYKYLNLYGNTFLIQGNYDSSLFYQQSALTLAQQMNDSLKMGISLFNIGINYRERASYEKAIEYCLLGRRIIDRLGNDRIEMQVDDALQLLYYGRAQYDEAITYGEKAVSLARKLHMKELLGNYLINLSLSYQSKNQFKKQCWHWKKPCKLERTCTTCASWPWYNKTWPALP
ncbi:tetratricopeptide repeat protein [Paraflavitalea speifideaquila]|uniref:tetratricopeptide repeat protein n=1 Tax=Paraflavitalea speifideaquila TaxID=3076558 RepID=UPI0028ECDDFA|nr:tetratricopeptide repeat protein [Paraflavitalea speifideiaquila]